MAWSKSTVVSLALFTFIFWVPLIQVLWDMYQFEMSLALFSGIFNTFYFLATSIYFMLLFLKLWSQSLKEEAE